MANIKVKVIRPFRDKYTDQVYNFGDVVTMTAARADEVMKKGRFIQKITESTNKKSKKAVASE